ncbi:flagellar hook protein FlgE [Noviherbaspirillum aridicola]|uniref:Flagellar hook protein FlgE n=1 Tax=Noviherbaspirillum aridicola TaxID=2849687 RepID=A0ABQ4Q620_9BURK|nr:flagellar hook protein FlgE [Noviherbaspirillum aridicola]GIZ52666.1 flagellar hook protein FlgE [Noviherbaspirillum aridicola]
MSFQQGLSGLNAASKNLETIGNNVANANTVGFKSSQTQFADVYANSLTGVSGAQAGIGVKVAGIVQQFTQGNITASSNPLDVAINGGGFFRMSNNGAITFARNGQFQMDNQGYIVNNTGARLTGYAANAAGVLATGAPTEINIRTTNLPPRATTDVDLEVNLDSRRDVIAVAFDPTRPETYTNSSSVSVFDSLGNEHVLQLYYVKDNPAAEPGVMSTWQVYGSLDGVMLSQANASGVATAAPYDALGQLSFDGRGQIVRTPATATTPSLIGTGSILPGGINLTSVASAVTAATGRTVVNNAVTPFNFSFNMGSATQTGSAFGVSKLDQDGYTTGRLSGFNVGEDGVITGRYTNGKSATLGQVVLANFTNPNGLQPLGNNEWAESSMSGQALVGPPNSAGLGTLQSSAVEDSNVDLTAELVNMITAQRVYQANAQTIKTQDQVLQTLVNLR